MFNGSNPVVVDTKGRLAIPTKYRDTLMDLCDGHLVVTINAWARCLLLYPHPTWEEVQRKLVLLPSSDEKAREIQRFMIGYASHLQMDGNGRTLLPVMLREYAQLDKKAVLMGIGPRFEVWNEVLLAPRLDSLLEQNLEGEASEALKNLVI